MRVDIFKTIDIGRSIILKIISKVILVTFAIAVTTEALCVVVDKIVVVVNDEVITQREVTRLLVPIYEKYEKEYTGKKLENKMLEAEDTIIDQLIDDKLILSEAKRRGIEATEKEIERKVQTIKERFNTEEQFREALAKENLSLSELRDRATNDTIKSKLVQNEMGGKVVITPSEVRKYYDDHIGDFTESAKALVLNILIKKKNEERKEEESKFLIEKIKEFAKRGDDFEALAKEYSEGPNAKEGEKMGLVEKGQMIKEIDDAIFSLEAGGISDIVKSPLGYHIFKVTEKTPEKVIDFEIVKYEIEDLIYKEKIDKNLKKWLKELRRNAYISIK